MRKLAWAWVAVAACGSKSSGTSDGGVTIDAPPAADSGPRPDSGPRVDLTTQMVVDGLSNTVWVGSPPGDSRLFIVEKVTTGTQGDVRIFDGGALVPTPYLTVKNVSTGSEQGVLGLAFHPQFASNGRVFVDYSDTNGDENIDEYKDQGDGTAKFITHVIFQPHPNQSNHNGGNVVFGPDGYLYFAYGDGGGSGDTEGNSRIKTTLLSKMSRIDVDHSDASCPTGTPCPYAIPTDNPFVGAGGGTREEIWAWGLRNPWRWSFDRMTGDLWIGDVGQGDEEEVDFQPAGDPGGEDYGWNIMEGDECYNGGSCDMSGKVLPRYTYHHDDGCAIMGGFVYRGTALTGHQGEYFWGDECLGYVKSAPTNGNQSWTETNATSWPNLSEAGLDSFGQDKDGELYLVSLGGAIFKVVPAP